jgi:hypothetical protein
MVSQTLTEKKTPFLHYTVIIVTDGRDLNPGPPNIMSPTQPSTMTSFVALHHLL